MLGFISSLAYFVTLLKSREYRNVTRDVFVVPHTGYDLHFGDALAELFLGANDALGGFIAWAKKEKLWDNTGK